MATQLVDGPHGHPVAFDVQGGGPLAVLVHGITENRTSWDPVTEALATQRTVVRVDLPGHGESGPGVDYSLQESAGAVAAVALEVAGQLGRTDPPDVVGHSLGGTVVSAYASAFATRSVVNVDQPLRLAAFQDGLRAMESALRGEDFDDAIAAMFSAMAGPLGADEIARIGEIRRPAQEVVLAIWAPVLTAPPEALDALVTEVGATITAPYLALHGIDPGPDYSAWLAGVLPNTNLTYEMWADHGHYPHLVDPHRFVELVTGFWGDA